MRAAEVEGRDLRKWTRCAEGQRGGGGGDGGRQS